MTRGETETAKKRAVTFVEHVLGDSDRAHEINDLDLDSWAEQRGVSINPAKKGKGIMASSRTLQKLSKEQLIGRVVELQETNTDLQDEVSSLTEKLDSIADIAAAEDEDETELDSDGEDEE